METLNRSFFPILNLQIFTDIRNLYLFLQMKKRCNMFVYWFSSIYEIVDFVWNLLDKIMSSGTKIAQIQREFDLKGLKNCNQNKCQYFFKLKIL